jgi:hypothetical protein
MIELKLSFPWVIDDQTSSIENRYIIENRGKAVNSRHK